MTKQTLDWELQPNPQNPNGQSEQTPKSYTEEEYKNAQAFGTKANQQLINISKQLAESNPKALLWMDANIQNKVVKDIWGYDNVEELKIMLPDVFEDWESSSSNWETTMEDMQRKQLLLERKLEEKDVADEIEKFELWNWDIISTIPDFKDKVREELKYISSSLPAKQRVDRASRLVTNSRWNIDVEAYLSLQGKTKIKSASDSFSDENILKAQNQLRQSLWLKQK